MRTFNILNTQHRIDLNLLLELFAITMSCSECFYKLMDLGREGNESIMQANFVIKILYIWFLSYISSEVNCNLPS